MTREEFDRAQAVLRAYMERGKIKKHDWPLYGKVRCGVCGHAMDYNTGRQMYFYCRTPRNNGIFDCASRTPESDILEAVSESLHAQAVIAVDLCRLWEEQHRHQKKDTAAMRKSLAGLRIRHQQLCQQINSLYESFALGETSKAEYLAEKAAAVQQRDAVSTQISELEAELNNLDADGGLQNGSVSAFGKYLDVEEITSEILSDILKEVRVFPGGRFEIVWNYRDEMERLMLDLQGD